MIIDLKYPTKWESVTREHLKILSKLILKNLSREEVLFDLLCRITGIHPLIKPGMDENTPVAEYLFKKKGAGRFWMPVWMVRQACEELAFMIETVGLPESPILSVNSKLHGVSFKSFYFADAYLSRYQSTKDISMILNMYKELTGKKIKRIAPEEVNAITIWWCGAKDYLKQTYPEVLKDNEEPSADKSPAEVLHEILSVLNKNEPGKNTEILTSEVHAVMHSLNNIYTTAKKV
ncbi:MAG: hypothetical protein Q8S24_10840 [Eubacteriales bacterium]|nr:hypothetical protein [Eubacteriales bacterium]